MAAKTKCPACGAKNPVANHRCRICTAIINPDAAAPAVEEEPVTPLGIDHFDAGEINRQIRPARERFGSSGGALAARIAAAQGGPTEAPQAPIADGAGFDQATFDPAPFDPAPSFTTPPPTASMPTTSNPIEYADEPFDPDALFRDMG